MFFFFCVCGAEKNITKVIFFIASKIEIVEVCLKGSKGKKNCTKKSPKGDRNKCYIVPFRCLRSLSSVEQLRGARVRCEAQLGEV